MPSARSASTVNAPSGSSREQWRVPRPTMYKVLKLLVQHGELSTRAWGQHAAKAGVYTPRDGRPTSGKCQMWGVTTGLALTRYGLVVRRRSKNGLALLYEISEDGLRWLKDYEVHEAQGTNT